MNTINAKLQLQAKDLTDKQLIIEKQTQLDARHTAVKQQFLELYHVNQTFINEKSVFLERKSEYEKKLELANEK